MRDDQEGDRKSDRDNCKHDVHHAKSQAVHMISEHVPDKDRPDPQ